MIGLGDGRPIGIRLFAPARLAKRGAVIDGVVRPDVVRDDMLVEDVAFAELLAAAVRPLEHRDTMAFADPSAAVPCLAKRPGGEFKAAAHAALPSGCRRERHCNGGSLSSLGKKQILRLHAAKRAGGLPLRRPRDTERTSPRPAQMTAVWLIRFRFLSRGRIPKAR